jgi:type IV pilus assembly protein PilY1
MTLNNSNNRKLAAKRNATSRLWALGLGFAATLAGLPGHAALVIPPTPLQSATPIPPNIMFILDDSGSMEEGSMPDNVPSVSPVNISGLAYTRNTLSYNPAVTYTAWKTATGGTVSGGTSFTGVYDDNSLASGNRDLSQNVQTFYVPKATATDLGQTASYFRYQILTNGQIWKAEYADGTAVDPTTLFSPPSTLSGNGRSWYRNTVEVPADAKDVTFKITGGSGGDPDLYVERGEAPDFNTDDDVNDGECKKTSDGREHTCLFPSPQSGTFHLGVYNDSNNNAYSGLTLTVTYVQGNSVGCMITAGWGWRNCVRETPTTARDEAQEKANYAMWYSFHRTRMKAAKAGASEAFSTLTGSKYRVGFTTIHNRSTSYVPVATHNGLFENVTASGTTAASYNRTNWFNLLHAAEGDGYTPLRTALNRVGKYYADSLTGNNGSAGPYGPASTNQLACRQNYAILTTDGYWNGTDGNDAETDFSGYVKGATGVTFANEDNTDGPDIAKPGETAKKHFTTGAPYTDSVSKTLADVAMYYWKNDLMPAMDNIVPASTANPAFWQHMVTFGISIGLAGTVSQTTVADVLRDGATSFTWPSPFANKTGARIDDLLHAAVNGHGAFAVASNPQEFAKALQAALADIIARENSGSNVTLSSTGLQTDTRAFVAKYKSGEWWGELQAFPVTNGGVGSPATWTASEEVPDDERSNVYTLGAGNGTAVATFPTQAQSDVLTSAVASYIKGNRTGEGTTYRTRTHLLGDIVNSSPAYVRELDGTTVVETVYIGSNDGMLHAFDASDGTELFNYVPNLLNMATLKNLSVVNNFEHQYFVDGPIVVSSRRQTPGKNYLVGALGRGGKGVYGLDVSSPSTFASTGKAWEYDGGSLTADRADMGLVIGKPLIAKISGGTVVAIISNGVNSASGKAALFVVNAATGEHIAKISTNNETDNGLSMPTAVDVDGNGSVDYVYAGDLQGNVWKFNLTASAAASWTATRLFTAVDPTDANKRQPISGGITVSFNPYTFTPWIFFGTGRYLTAGDKDDMSVQTWYGMQDTGTAIAGRSALKPRDIVVGGTIAGRAVRSFEQAAANDMSGKSGWYIDLDSPPNNKADGERMVGSQVVVGGSILVASSIIPQSSDCDVSGRGFVNAVDIFTGAAVSTPFFDANGDGAFNNLDTLKNGTETTSPNIPVGSIDLGVGMPTDPTVLENLVVVGGSKGTTGSVGIQRVVKDGRISWREILKD